MALRPLAEADSVVMLTAARNLGLIVVLCIAAGIWWVVRRG